MRTAAAPFGRRQKRVAYYTANGTALKADGDAWTFQFERSGRTDALRVWAVGDKAVIATMKGNIGKLTAILKTARVR